MDYAEQGDIQPAPLRGKQRILRDIKEMGYEFQNQRLMNLGFTCLSRNRKYLREHAGNLDEVYLHLAAKFGSEGTRQYRKKHRSQKREENNENEKNERNPHRRIHRRKSDAGLQSVLDNALPEPEYIEYKKLPENITRLYLDGNNMLFVKSKLRKLMLNQQNKEAEGKLADIVYRFTQEIGHIDLIIVFENSGWCVLKKTDEQNEDSKTFTVISASPRYKSTDEALVDLASKQGGNVKNCMFVTSNRKLHHELREVGATHIMRSRDWFKLAKSTLGSQTFKSLL